MLDDEDIESAKRILARTAKIGAKGAASVGDLGALPINALLIALGREPIASPSETIGDYVDQWTGGYSKTPDSGLGRILDTAGEFVAGGGPIGALAKGTKAEKALSMNTLRDLFQTAGAGAGARVAQEVAPNNPYARLAGGIAGAGATGAVEGAGRALAYGAKQIPNLHPSINAQKQLQGVTAARANPTLEAAGRLGEHLSPAEAAHSPVLAKKQGNLGTSEQGAERLQQYGEQKAARREENITGLLEDISGAGKGSLSVDEKVHDVAKDILKSRKQKLIDRAAPVYAKADTIDLPEKNLEALYQEYPVIKEAVEYVLDSSSFAPKTRGFAPNSTRILDLAKKRLDDRIGKLGGDAQKEERSLLIQAKNALLDKLDAVNPTYKEARGIYSEELPAIKKLNNSPVGKIANREGDSIKNIGKDIFDKQQTNDDIFRKSRDEIYQVNPEAWNGIVRQEMERRIGSPAEGASNFYNKLLKDPKSYRLFHEALSNNPEAQRTLADMRLVYKDLIETPSVRGAAGQANASISDVRSPLRVALKLADNLLGGVYDQAAIDLITDPKWASQVKAAQAIKPKEQKLVAWTGLLESANNQIEQDEVAKLTPEEQQEYQELSQLSDDEFREYERLLNLSEEEFQAEVEKAAKQELSQTGE